MKILIVGSKGFIGNHAYHFFSHQSDIECWGCGVSMDYNDDHYFQMDATNSDFNEIFESVSFDACINCSGAASVPLSLQNPLRDFTLNTYNVAKLLDAIKKHRPFCKFINLSSAAVYGNPVNLPIKESMICAPVSPYGRHKHMAESLCMEYKEFYHIDTCNLRIFSAYGPGLRKQLLWDIIQKSKINQHQISLFGTGKETRDFIFVDDIVSAINFLIRLDYCPAPTLNLASGKQTNVKDLAFMLLKEIEYNGAIVFTGNERLGDPINWEADISLIKKSGWEPKIDLEEGIKKYIKWVKKETLE